MKCTALFLCVGGFLSCTAPQWSTEVTAPQLLIQTPLPEIPASIRKPPSQIDMKLFIGEDGSVVKVRLIDPSGSPDWDSLTVERIRQWRFLPARRDGQAVSSWFYLRASVKYVHPLFYSLSALFCTTQEKAEALYTSLEEGIAFENLDIRNTADTVQIHFRDLGVVNVYSYPEKVRHVLLNLDQGEYSKPVKYGDEYVIFQREKE